MLEAEQQRYTKTEFNAQLRQRLRERSKGSVELKFQNISAVLHDLELPFIRGYKPRSNAQLLLRQAVQQFVLNQPGLVSRVVDAMEEVKTSAEQSFHACLVEPPALETVAQLAKDGAKVRFPRKTNWAQRDEANRHLGRAGEQWVIGFEQRRLVHAGYPELFQQLDCWTGSATGATTSSRMSGPASIASSRSRPPMAGMPRPSSSAATNWISQQRRGCLPSLPGFQFREEPRLYILNGPLADQLHLEPIDFRASFRRLVG